MYQQQKKYKHERNWYNEFISLLKMYRMEYCGEKEICEYTRLRWKKIVKTHVKNYILTELNKLKEDQSKINNMTHYKDLRMQDYFQYLTPTEARVLFKVRTGTIDVKKKSSIHV